MTKVKLLKTYPKAGGLNRLPLLLFGLGIVLMIDLHWGSPPLYSTGTCHMAQL